MNTPLLMLTTHIIKHLLKIKIKANKTIKQLFNKPLAIMKWSLTSVEKILKFFIRVMASIKLPLEVLGKMLTPFVRALLQWEGLDMPRIYTMVSHKSMLMKTK